VSMKVRPNKLVVKDTQTEEVTEYTFTDPFEEWVSLQIIKTPKDAIKMNAIFDKFPQRSLARFVAHLENAESTLCILDIDIAENIRDAWILEAVNDAL